MQQWRIKMKRRNTSSKKDVLAVLEKANAALSHDMIQEQLSTINRATIYRILNRFCEDGIVHRILGEDGKQYFALCVSCGEGNHNHNHLHFQCVKCKKVECLEQQVTPLLPEGYVAEGFYGLVSGTCPDCL